MPKFIVLEGLDRCGKSTQCEMLMSHFSKTQQKVEMLQFPDRSTTVGKLIDEILKGKNIDIHVLHLLFSANRWEVAERISTSDADIIICDRYIWSGIAYSMAKGLAYDWCKSPDLGLPEPDVIIYLDLDPTICAERKDYGSEIFERLEFQSRVRDAYTTLISKSETRNIVVDANQSPDLVHSTIVQFLF